MTDFPARPDSFSDLFGVFDHKAGPKGTFINIFSSPSEGEAIRAFSDAVLNEASPYFKHPEEYSLFQLATLNLSNGQVFPIYPNRFLIHAGGVQSAFPSPPGNEGNK